MAKQNIASAVSAAIQPVVIECGLNLWDVQFVKEGADRILRVTIDKQGGVSIDDCEKVHRAIDPVIDDLDPIQESYCLEVTSPGLGRRLIRPEHFAAFIGQTVIVRLIRADLSGCKEYRGRLEAYGDGGITLLCGEEQKLFEQSAVSFTKLCDDENLFNK